jgi:Mn2+/Fe2+ NRAMP family transporter
MMMAVQEMSARLGLVTPQGLTKVMERRYPRPLVLALVVLLFLANGLNIAADLRAMGAVLALLVGGPEVAYVVGFGLLIAVLAVSMPYRRYANILKWLTLALFTYVIAGLFIHQDWGRIAEHTLLPRWPGGWSSAGLVAAILGTTISPYLFFWQESEEVEESRRKLSAKALGQRLKYMRRDVALGMIFSNLIMFFIIITTAATLHQAGITNITTPDQAASALQPVAGQLTFLLFAVGIIGTGLLAVPVLAGSAAYALAEVFGWHEGLSKKLRQAPAFYGVIIGLVAAGIISIWLHLSAVKLLLLSAVINGLLAPVMLWFIMRLSDDKNIVGEWRSPEWVRWWGWSAFGLMAIVAVIVILQLF